MYVYLAFCLALLPVPQVAETTIDGTQGDDLVVVNLEKRTVAVNGVVQAFPSDGSNVRVRGLGGNDRVVFRADPDRIETASMATGSIAMNAGQVQVVAEGFETIDLRADADDRVIMTDSPGDDFVLIEPDKTTLVCDDCSLVTTAVRSFELVADQGGNDEVSVAGGVVNRLVARPDEVRLTSVDQRVWICSGVEQFVSTDISEFSFFDSPGDDRLVARRRFVSWATPTQTVSQVGVYENVVATSDRFGRSGNDEALLRMLEQENTTVRVAKRAGTSRDTTLIFADVEKQLTLTNFETTDIDILPGVPGAESVLTFDDTEASVLRVDAENKSATLNLSNVPVDVFSTGFDRVESVDQIFERICFYDGSSGADVLRHDDLPELGVSTTTISSEQFEFTSQQPSNAAPLIWADAGAGFDEAFFMFSGEHDVTVSQEEVVVGETFSRSGFTSSGFENTVSVFIAGEGSLRVDANRSEGPVGVAASPSSIVFAGGGFEHRFFDFSSAIVQSFDLCFANNFVRDYGPNEIAAVYNARHDSSLVIEDYQQQCFPFMGTTGGDYFGTQFQTDLSNVVFTEEQLLIGLSLPRGGLLVRSEGFETLSVINVAADSILGDVNRDGIVNFLDIAPFIAVLSSGQFQDEADIDRNGVLNFLDIAPFLAILSGPSVG